MRRGLTILIALVASLAFEPASAQSRFGVDLHGAWNRFGMRAINDTLTSFNREFGTALRPVDGSGSWGMGLYLWPQPDVRMRLGFEQLAANSKDSRVGFDLGAQSFTLGVAWFTSAEKPVRFGAGAAVGPLFAHGGFHAPGVSLTSSGNGFGGHLDGEVLAPLWGGLSANGLIGYRYAAINGLQLQGSTTRLRPSYDGWLVRIGMTYDLTP